MGKDSVSLDDGAFHSSNTPQFALFSSCIILPHTYPMGKMSFVSLCNYILSYTASSRNRPFRNLFVQMTVFPPCALEQHQDATAHSFTHVEPYYTSSMCEEQTWLNPSKYTHRTRYIQHVHMNAHRGQYASREIAPHAYSTSVQASANNEHVFVHSDECHSRRQLVSDMRDQVQGQV